MASKEDEVDEDIRGISEPLLGELLDHERLQSFIDNVEDYMENWYNMENWQNTADFKREREYAIDDVALFLEEFPAQREEFERCIRCLWEMADAIDKTHKTCTVVSIAANSTSASSGILTILGVTLAPFTAGGSLILTATGLGLGAVAAATGLSASIYESVTTSKETKKAQELMEECGESLRMTTCPDETDFSSKLLPNNEAVGKNFVPTAAGVFTMYKSAKGIQTNVNALKCVQATGLRSLATRATEAASAFWGKIRGAKQVEKAFAGTTLAMSKGARLLSGAATGAFVLLDAYNIVQNAKHLTEGAKAEKAAEIRDKARKLEAELWDLNKLYEELKHRGRGGPGQQGATQRRGVLASGLAAGSPPPPLFSNTPTCSSPRGRPACPARSRLAPKWPEKQQGCVKNS